MHKIIYRVKVKQANGEKIPRVVEATHKGQAIRHAAKDTIEATVMSAKEVLDWIRSGGKVEVADAPEEIPLTAAQVGELAATPGAVRGVAREGERMSLPHDIARCPGVGDDIDGWREGCEDCQRRTDPGGDYTPHMEPPPIIVFECESRIEPTSSHQGASPSRSRSTEPEPEPERAPRPAGLRTRL